MALGGTLAWRSKKIRKEWYETFENYRRSNEVVLKQLLSDDLVQLDWQLDNLMSIEFKEGSMEHIKRPGDEMH